MRPERSPMSAQRAGVGPWGTLLLATAAGLAVLALIKFIALKPIVFLLLAILFGVGAWLSAGRNRAGVILLGLLNLLVAVIFGAHLFDKGFDSDRYQAMSDFFVVVIGFPLALLGLVAVAFVLRTRETAARG